MFKRTITRFYSHYCVRSKMSKIFYLFLSCVLLGICAPTLALDNICSPPGCKVYNVTNPTDGVKLVVNDWGALQTNKTAILFIHGFPHDGLFWTPQIDSLLRLNYRLITMDLRGQGLSGKPLNPSSYTQTLFANDIKAVLSTLNVKKVILVGQSLGGIPLESYLNVYGINYNGVKVKGVVFVAAIADAHGSSFTTPETEALLGAGITATTPDDFMTATMNFLTLSTFAPLNPGLNNFYLAQDLLSPSAARGALIGGIQTPGNFNLNVSSVTVKTLIIWGENDAVVSEGGGEYLHHAIAGSQLIVLPNTGHLVMIERSVAFNLILGNFADSLN